MLSVSNPQVKGAITGLLMVAAHLLLYYTLKNQSSPLQYITYLLYAGGIVWTIFTYSKSEKFTGSFGASFQQGFRCFIVTTVIMVLFTFLFIKMHPEFATETAENYRLELVKQANKTPAEIEEEVKNVKEHYSTMIISGAVFGYLILGALITAVLSAILVKRK